MHTCQTDIHIVSTTLACSIITDILWQEGYTNITEENITLCQTFMVGF